MESLIRNSYYQGKNMLKDIGLSFWILAYPLIMAIFFHIAFSSILNIELKDVNVGIEEGNPIVFALEQIDFININKISNDEIEEKLNSKEIYGFIDKDLNITVKESGINQTIIKEVVDQIKQMQKLNRPIQREDFSVDYIVDKNQKSDSITIIFYSLIAMVSTYSVYTGIETVSLIQANLSSLGARISVVPLKKHIFLLSGIISSLILNLVSNGILLLFMRYVLKLNLFTEMKYSLIFIILGNLFGIALGILIGASNNKPSNTKISIGVVITLFLSFLSGMMGVNMKIIIDEKAPILSRINPISIITNNLYRINLLENTKHVSEGIVILSVYTILFIAMSYFFLRRKNYDSI